MVSRSRSSPTRITLGACLKAARNASAKFGVSLCSSRWWMVDRLVVVQKLDRVLDGDDVAGLLLVDRGRAGQPGWKTFPNRAPP